MKDVTPEIGENLYWAVFNGFAALVLLFFCVVLVNWQNQTTKRMHACVEVGMEWDGGCRHPVNQGETSK